MLLGLFKPARKPRTRLWLGRFCRAIAVLALLVLLNRNWLAQTISVRVCRSLLGAELQIGSIDIGCRRIIIQGVHLLEPNQPSDTQVEVDRVELAVASWSDLFSGVYLQHADVQSPTLHLRFDADGKLLSEFYSPPPSEEESAEGRSPCVCSP